MYKIILSLTAIFLLVSNSFAQEVEKSKPSVYQAPASDFFMIHIQNEFWNNDVPDSVNKKGLSPSIGVYINKDFPINNSNFSVSLGVGIASSNIHFEDDQVLDFKDTSNELRFLDDAVGYKRYKYNQTFIEAPVELRYFGNKFNRNKGFKAALGIKVANLISAHTKKVYTENGEKYKEKLSTKRFAETWRLTPYARLGWGNFSLMASYQITTVFELDKGPIAYPFSFGFAISGL